MEKLLEHLGYATPFIYAAAAYTFFAWLDKEASDEAKTALASTMKLKDYKKEQIASALIEVFDRIYTAPLLHWRALCRSILFTFIVSVLFLAKTIVRSLYEMELDDFFFFVGFWTNALCTNVLTDYVALFVIRSVLSVSGSMPVLALVAGTTVAVAIVAFGAAIRAIIMATYFADEIVEVIGLFGAEFLAFWFYALPAIVVFAWLPLLALGILVLRAISPLSWIVARAQWALKDGKDHPLKAVGYIAAIFVFAIAVGWKTFFETDRSVSPTSPKPSVSRLSAPVGASPDSKTLLRGRRDGPTVLGVRRRA